MTARKVSSRLIFDIASAMSGRIFRGTFVVIVWPSARISPIGSSMKSPWTMESRIPDNTSCWRAARVKSLSPAAFRIRAYPSACWPFRWWRPFVMANPRVNPYSS